MLNLGHKIFLITLLFSSLLVTSYAQGPASQTSRKVDSYDDKIHSSEAEQWHLEDFREMLLKEPDTKAYIIAYGGHEDNPGKARRYALRAKNWLVKWRGIEAKRIVAVDGGRREGFIVELWLVPNGVPPPTPAPTVNVTNDLGDNLLYDEFDVGYDNFGNRAEDTAARLEGFAAALRKEPDSWGCVIAYAQTGDDQMGMDWDSPGTALKIAKGQRNYLIKNGIAPSRLTAVDGGYSGRVVELWLMRPHARFDKGPFLYPGRLKANRNGVLTVNNGYTPNLCCKACIRGRTDPYILRNGKRVKPK